MLQDVLLLLLHVSPNVTMLSCLLPVKFVKERFEEKQRDPFLISLSCLPEFCQKDLEIASLAASLS